MKFPPYIQITLTMLIFQIISTHTVLVHYNGYPEDCYFRHRRIVPAHQRHPPSHPLPGPSQKVPHDHKLPHHIPNHLGFPHVGHRLCLRFWKPQMVYPFKARHLITKRRIRVFIAASWLVSSILGGLMGGLPLPQQDYLELTLFSTILILVLQMVVMYFAIICHTKHKPKFSQNRSAIEE